MVTRRNFLRLVATLLGSTVATACAQAVSTATVTPPAGNAPTPTSPPKSGPTTTPAPEPSPSPFPSVTPRPLELLTVRGDQFYQGAERFPIKGFNYYPRLHPWRTFNAGEWDPQEIERELRLGADLGANVVRTFVDYNYSIDLKTPQPTPTYLPLNTNYLQNLQQFLDIAGGLGLRVILTLFDSMDGSLYQQPNRWIALQYLRELIPPFANDPRIMCWDLQNEPDRAIRNVGAEPVISFFKNASAEIRKIDPGHLQTIGWIDRAKGQYFADLDHSLDFWCFHYYDKIDQLGDLIAFYKGITTKPILLEEFGLATGGPGQDGAHTELDQSLHYSLVYALVQGHALCGSLFWILTDFPKGLAGNPPLPDDSPENHYGVYRLDYSEKPVTRAVRYAWKGS